ncbi:tetratricopeptide repeat protein [Ferrovibrio sp.]|uniref:tetratricopeptide repeat protein n=1 Tax=Ferrovibrio sp. TaxID=1917215 RepID=UPI0026117B71|nr:tetratricopeptide repeat protein [Ferrovibrio sp.]
MDWRKALHLAVELHQAGRLDNAIQLYRVVLQQQPDNDDALHLLGMALEQAGQPQQGKAFVERAIMLNPGASTFRNSLGNIFKALQQPDAAADAYRQALQIDPRNAEAHNNLGLIAQGQEDWEAARAHFGAALNAEPGLDEAAFNLAVTDWRADRREAALPAVADLLGRRPDYIAKLFHLAREELERKDLAAAETLIPFLENRSLSALEWQYLQGGLAELQGDLEAAERKYRAVLAINPDYLDGLRQLGRVLIDRKDHKSAIPVLEHALALQAGENPATAVLLAWAYNGAGKTQRSADLFEKLLAKHPDNISLWTEYGQTLSKLERPADAGEAYRRALALSPDDGTAAQIHANLAGTEIRRDRLDAAEAACRQALALDPESLTGTGNLANVRELQKRFNEAEQLYRGLLQKHPEDANTHNNLGIMLLHLGRYAEAWPHFAWRVGSSGWTTPDSSRGLPLWDGKFPPPGRLLVWREQGVGDEILFSSLLPELLAGGADVVVATERRLVPLFSRSFPGITVVPNEDPLDIETLRLVCQRPFGDLGAILRPDINSFGRHPAAYLKVDHARRDAFRQRYAASGQVRVGISWNSNNRRTGSSKSVALADLAPFMRESDAGFISLQYGDAAAEAAGFAQQSGLPLLHDAEVDPLKDIDAQAAQIAALDIVVTVSTAAAHLAAAIGVPTLLLLPGPRGQLWYWGADGERTPWYPCVRICRANAGETVAALVNRALVVFRGMRNSLAER